MRCRCCGRASFGEVIDLGEMPLVNNLLRAADEPCPRWPLKMVFCRGCSLAQLTQTPPPQAMFSEYLYLSSQSKTMVDHACRLVEQFVISGGGQRVLEIASNDGYLLKPAKDRGATVLGVEPARNIAAHANAAGIPTVCEFFDETVAARLIDEWGTADVAFANNVLAHVPDPNRIMRGLRMMIGERGTAHVEVPWVVSMIDRGAFDTIYHEHHCYFSINAMRTLCHRNDLKIVDVELIDVHGGSLHLRVSRTGDEATLDRWCDDERKRGVFEDAFYQSFALRVQTMREQLKRAMSQFEVVAAYGAAAKGVVLLNSFELDTTQVPFVADVSPHKQGRFVPGTGQRIVSPEELLERKPDAALLLPWNIREEILERNQGYRNAGGRFIVAIPEVQVL